MSEKAEGGILTFDELLSEAVNKDISRINASGLEVEPLSESTQEKLLERLAEIKFSEEVPELVFDEISLRHIQEVFKRTEQLRKNLGESGHPAKALYSYPLIWLRESYPLMYEQVAFLEAVRALASGKDSEEKEFVFRTMVGKLIRSQETVRKIKNTPEFIERYLKGFPKLEGSIVESVKKAKNLGESPAANEAIFMALHLVLSNMEELCILLLKDIGFEFPEQAAKDLKAKNYYNALVLSVRHGNSKLFDCVTEDKYELLVQHLSGIIATLYAHPNIYLYHHIKREYLIDWLVYKLRDYDRDSLDRFYQKEKAEIYEEFEELELKPALIKEIKERSKLDAEEILKYELRALRELPELSFYDLMLKIYSQYKDDPLIGAEMPISQQALTAAGDTAMDVKVMAATAAHQLKKTEASPEKSRFLSSFVQTATVMTKLKRSFKGLLERRTISSKHTGKTLPPCFPVLENDTTFEEIHQNQNLCFGDTNGIGNFHEEQEFFINFLCTEELSNKPVNLIYTRFFAMTSMTLRVYRDQVQKISKKISRGGKVLNLSEEVLYVQVDKKTVLALGMAMIGHSPNVGKMPDERTCYFRLFLNLKNAQKYGLENEVCKEFSFKGSPQLFFEAPIAFIQADIALQVMVLQGLGKLVAGFPKDDYQMLEDPESINFFGVLKEKLESINSDTSSD